MGQDGIGENVEFTCKYFVVSVTFNVILKEWWSDLIGWHSLKDRFDLIFCGQAMQDLVKKLFL